jgi:hypothetical protein
MIRKIFQELLMICQEFLKRVLLVLVDQDRLYPPLLRREMGAERGGAREEIVAVTRWLLLVGNPWFKSPIR